MPLAQAEKNENLFKKTEYFKTESGVHTIRILDENSTIVYFHFLLGRYSVKCLGDDCPVCQRNKQIIVDNPNDFKNVSGYASKQYKHFWNVLDKTPVITCTGCNHETKADLNDRFPSACPECGMVIQDIEPQPLNKVKVFSLYETKAVDLGLIEQTTKNKKKEVIGWTNYDIAVNIAYTQQGSKKKAVLNFTALPLENDPVEVDPLDLYDLQSVSVLNLSADEITALLSGVSLSDIYKARRPDTNTEEITSDVSPLGTIDEIINDLIPG